uniref:Uncharacterized protein n=1 Tax=Desulfovibrio sp. U5L TaxID=596152 RepID=I2Q071_9BACT
MYEQKRTVQANRLRRRVKALEQANAPYPFRARAMKQLRKVENAKELNRA